MILESFRAGLAFLPRAWSRPWFMILVAISVAAALGVVALASPRLWLATGVVVVLILLPPLAQAPLYELALPDAPRTASFIEGLARYLRLLVVNLLTVVFLAIPGLLFAVVGLGFAYGMAYGSPGFDPKDAASWTTSGPVAAGAGWVGSFGELTLLWLLSRVSLGPAASVIERRVLMLSSWPLTRGLGWRILVARLVLGASALAVLWGTAQALRGVTPAGWLIRYGPVLGGVLLLLVYVPLEIGVLSYFHARRSPLPVVS